METELLNRIWEVIEKTDDITAYRDYTDVLSAGCDVEMIKRATSRIEKVMGKSKNVVELYEIHRRLVGMAARDDFDSFMLYAEWDRPPEEQFYGPRRAKLRKYVEALQKLANDELDELFLSMPPRCGKTTTLMFYIAWLMGRNTESSNLYSAYSDIITTAFYNGVLEVLTDSYTYKWHDVFPTAKLVGTNAKDETLNLDRKKRYPSLTCRSLYGTLNGACDCNGILISDDLIGGIEEALNKDRLAAAWTKVDNNLLSRAKQGAKILWCGTRWSMVDPIGVRLDTVENIGYDIGNAEGNTESGLGKKRYEVISVPALNENEESNFNYMYGVGYDTAYYKERRAAFERNNDIASWMAMYQQQPIERSGALFEPEDMRFFNGVLDDKINDDKINSDKIIRDSDKIIRVYMAVDPAFGGGDYTAGPICVEYEDGSVYIPDVIYNNGEKTVTQPEIAQKVKKWHVSWLQIEANKMTMAYKDDVEKLLDKGVRVTTKAAPNNTAKETRIFDRAPEIREMYFLEEGKRSKEYSLFMQNVYAFKLTGKNKHDDAPDSLAQAAAMRRGSGYGKVEVFKRPF
ncbi:MAG: phage terminase large subunit [Clostridia bacterium]|nr:phage terminase large subunit [Clostridia bacterium]